MKKDISQIYSLLQQSPEQANMVGLEMIESTTDQDFIDSVNWARGYALLELEDHESAKKIYLDIFERTKNPKALHQLAYVERTRGNIESALSLFAVESALIDTNDLLSKSANLYELTRCNLIIGRKEHAFKYFKAYEKIEFVETDPNERACFFRLKGDLMMGENPDEARKAYQESLKFFEMINDLSGIEEIRSRIEQAGRP